MCSVQVKFESSLARQAQEGRPSALCTDGSQGRKLFLILHVQAVAITVSTSATAVIVAAASSTTSSTATSTPDRVLEVEVSL